MERSKKTIIPGSKISTCCPRPSRPRGPPLSHRCPTMSEEKETTPPAAAAASSEEKPAEDPPVDLAKQNEQTVAQTNAINDAVKATQVGRFWATAKEARRFQSCKCVWRCRCQNVLQHPHHATSGLSWAPCFALLFPGCFVATHEDCLLCRLAPGTFFAAVVYVFGHPSGCTTTNVQQRGLAVVCFVCAAATGAAVRHVGFSLGPIEVRTHSLDSVPPPTNDHRATDVD